MLSHRFVQLVPISGFYVRKSACEILYSLEIVAQLSLLTTIWNLVQPFVIFGWVGVGVTMPGLVDVGGGVLLVDVGVEPTQI